MSEYIKRLNEVGAQQYRAVGVGIQNGLRRSHLAKNRTEHPQVRALLGASPKNLTFMIEGLAKRTADTASPTEAALIYDDAQLTCINGLALVHKSVSIAEKIRKQRIVCERFKPVDRYSLIYFPDDIDMFQRASEAIITGFCLEAPATVEPVSSPASVHEALREMHGSGENGNFLFGVSGGGIYATAYGVQKIV